VRASVEGHEVWRAAVDSLLPASHYRRRCRLLPRALLLTNDATEFKKWTFVYSLAYSLIQTAGESRFDAVTSARLCFSVGWLRNGLPLLPSRLTAV
jgi:hypothetical protein